MTTIKTRPPKARDRIIAAAEDLFYKQGYQATVVNQIIDAAGVSKPTFYSHFPSKEELCVAYLSTRRRKDVDDLRGAARQAATPFDRYMAPARALRVRMIETGYSGCRYFNMLSEIKDMDSPIVAEVRQFNDAVRTLIRDVTYDLVQSDAKYAHLDADTVADAYYVIFGGAIMVSQEYKESWPLDLALDQIARLTA